MAERVEPFDLGVMWEPNAPEATLLIDDAGRAALALRSHLNDIDERTVVLKWDGVLDARMGPPNDEALVYHPLYSKGLKDVKWAGLVHDSSTDSS